MEPKTFEESNQNSGYILYETVVPLNAPENGLLDACFMRDRTHVYVNYVSRPVIRDIGQKGHPRLHRPEEKNS